MSEGFGEPVMGSAAALSANPSSYLDNPLVGGQDCIQLHFGSPLFHEQHLVGFGGHGIAAGARGAVLRTGRILALLYRGESTSTAENGEGD